MIVTALTTHFTTLALGALSTNLVILMHVGRTADTRKPMMTRVHISPPFESSQAYSLQQLGSGWRSFILSCHLAAKTASPKAHDDLP